GCWTPYMANPGTTSANGMAFSGITVLGTHGQKQTQHTGCGFPPRPASRRSRMSPCKERAHEALHRPCCPHEEPQCLVLLEAALLLHSADLVQYLGRHSLLAVVLRGTGGEG